MKKYILILVLALAVTGCGETVHPSQVAKAVELCEANGGWKKLKLGPFFYDVVCSNGAQFNNYVLLAEQEPI